MAKGAQKSNATASRPKIVKNTSKKTQERRIDTRSERFVTKAQQQACLDIFRNALKPSNDDNAIIQEVKGHLFNRDFDAAFGKDDYLRAYASRWSPSRALAYLQILENLADYLLPSKNASVELDDALPFRVVCLGGGAGGELVALAAWFAAVSAKSSQDAPTTLCVDLVDQADWSKVVENVRQTITTPPTLSIYASQAKKDANKALLQSREIFVNFCRLDVLEEDRTVLLEAVTRADLVTCMFTLNELYEASVPKTQKLLASLTDSVRPGSHLLVIDTPGISSTVSINGSDKKYPMQWLLDHTLRGPSTSDEESIKWQRLEHDDSQWFRLSPELQYPIKLENMQYQVHLYERADTGEG